ncbi:MAG: permease prefix domain 1-containing protein [Planctomycetota bacterium]
MSEREFEAYLNLLARTLKLSEAQRRRIAGELRHHLEERLAELVEQGHDRDAAILAALDEFGDANILASDLTQPQQQLRRRKLMQTGFATIAAAALIALAVTYLIPTNHQGTPTQAPAIAGNEPDDKRQTDAEAGGPKPEAGFVYIMGVTDRPGAYTVPGHMRLSLKQLIASSGGLGALSGRINDEEIRFRIVRRIDDQTESTTYLTYAELNASEKPFYLQPDDLIHIEADLPSPKLDLVFTDMPLSAVVDHFRQTTGVNYHVNWTQLSSIGINHDTPVSVQLKSIDPATAWSLILDSLPNEHIGFRPVMQQKYGVTVITKERYDEAHDWAGGFVRGTFDATALTEIYLREEVNGKPVTLDEADKKLRSYLSEAIGQSSAISGPLHPDVKSNRYTLSVYAGIVTVNQPREIVDQIATVLIETERLLRQ